ncbi:MAG: hypothetical protein KKD44_26120 [Proteobacteria bacterium]|nr:hypothetical protein [Pseudomonadota bacterium]
METKFQYYPAYITSNKPKGVVTLKEFIRCHLNPKPDIQEIFHKIARVAVEGDNEEKSRLKQNYLYYFTPCVMIKKFRRYEDIHHWTGLLVVDWDHIDYAEEFRDFLFQEYPSIIATWTSPSRKGTKALFKIPIVHSTDEFKEYYFGVASEMEQYAGLDTSSKNCVLPLFQSWDPQLKFRTDATIWDTKGIFMDSFDDRPTYPALNIQSSENDTRRVIQIIHTGFHNINNVGHPNLRSLCLTVGGYVACGYISEIDALAIIDNHIETHHYLKKGIYGYKKTARWAIGHGKSKPLTL